MLENCGHWKIGTKFHRFKTGANTIITIDMVELVTWQDGIVYYDEIIIPGKSPYFLISGMGWDNWGEEWEKTRYSILTDLEGYLTVYYGGVGSRPTDKPNVFDAIPVTLKDCLGHVMYETDRTRIIDAILEWTAKLRGNCS